ncbi:MAG: hypothetical protein AAFO82_08825, partial [Bacteroidota bacterium]
MKKIVLAFIALITINCQSSKKVKDTTTSSFTQLTNLIDQYAAEALQKGNINSIALAIYKDGAVYH